MDKGGLKAENPHMAEPKTIQRKHFRRDTAITKTFDPTEFKVAKVDPLVNPQQLKGFGPGFRKPGCLQVDTFSFSMEGKDSLFSRVLGRKVYQIDDHLGNVRVVINDIKEPDADTLAITGIPKDFTATLLVYNNYYGFGSLMPGRHFQGALGYRYGFNGKEMDNEVKGTGNQYDYGFRIYDPRIARFLSVDPLFQSYPWYTPFQFAGNNPIKFIDLDGLEEAEKEITITTPPIKNPTDNAIRNNTIRDPNVPLFGPKSLWQKLLEWDASLSGSPTSQGNRGVSTMPVNILITGTGSIGDDSNLPKPNPDAITLHADIDILEALGVITARQAKQIKLNRMLTHERNTGKVHPDRTPVQSAAKRKFEDIKTPVKQAAQASKEEDLGRLIQYDIYGEDTVTFTGEPGSSSKGKEDEIKTIRHK